MARVLPSPEVSAVLGVRDLGHAFREPVVSQARALFVSGTLDGNTPPAQAEAVRRGFARSAHVVVENGGHEDLATEPEVRAAIVRFLAGELDRTVTKPPLAFVPLDGTAAQSAHPSLDARPR